MYTVELKKLKGIKELEFPFPEHFGVYVLTGANGSGKTSLLVALNRLGDKSSFANNFKTKSEIDTYSEATITYRHDNDSVTYRKGGKKWVQTTKSKGSLISEFPFVNTLYISTAGLRTYSQQLFNIRENKIGEVSQSIIRSLNEILNTEKFNNLKFITVKEKKGRQKTLNRQNKLYVIKENDGDFYSEQNFSLGERLLLNTLDALEHISPRTLLLIDEVELALHPIAQVKFYNYLAKQAREKELAVIISTHSSTLIKHAGKCIYLENDGTGRISVTTDCTPAYILRAIATIEDQKPDFIFFVEDDMASRYLRAYLRRFLSDINSHLVCPVLYVGGYAEVIKLLQSYPMVGYPKTRIQAFLDHDAQDTYNNLLQKGNQRTESENRLFKLFNDNSHNISYLSITPELGVWQWIQDNPEAFRNFMDEKHGMQHYDVRDIIAQTTAEEVGKQGGNLKEWAKGCFKNFKEKLHQQNPQISEDEVVSDLIICYMRNHYDLNDLKQKFFPFLIGINKITYLTLNTSNNEKTIT